MWLLTIIVSIYLSVKQICHAGCHEPLQQRGALSLENVWVPKPPQSPPHHSVPAAFDDECAFMGDTWLSRGMAAPRYPHRSLKHLLFNVSTALRSLLMAPSNPPFFKKHVRRTHPTAVQLCVCVCVVHACQAVLSPWSSVTSDSKLVPVAKQPGLLSHQKLLDINVIPQGGSTEEFGDIPELTKIDWQFIPSVTVKNHLLKIAHFSKRKFEKCPTWLRVVVPPPPLHWEKSVLVSSINKDRDVNTLHPCDQPTTVKAPEISALVSLAGVFRLIWDSHQESSFLCYVN